MTDADLGGAGPPTGSAPDASGPAGSAFPAPSGPPAGYGMGGPSDARILDQGYRRYDGPRRGVAGAVRAVHKAAVQRALGLKRSARFKIVPFLVAVLSYLPAIVFVGAVALLPDAFEDELPFDYADYYGYITAAIVLFVSFVTPEILCTDRRTGMLGLYLSGPIDRTRYLIAKGAAIATVLAVVTLGPPVLLLIGFTLTDSGPDGALDALQTVVRIVGSAAIVTIWYTALSMAVASLTDRRAFASAGIILTVLVSSAVANSLVEADLSSQLLLADLFTLPFELVRRVYGVRGAGKLDELATTSLALTAVAVVIVLLGVVAARYRRLSVTR